MATNNTPSPTHSLLRQNSGTKLNLSKGDNLKNSSAMNVKRELPVDSKLFTTERLSSFRLPRDLTLGGSSLGSAKHPIPNLLQNSNKKVYTPNLNAVRNKNVDVKTSKDTTFVNSRGRGRGGRSDRGGATRGRGAAAGSSNARNSVISQTGLFSQGAGDGTSKRLFRSFRGPGDSESSASSLRRPTISTKREKIDPIQEQKRISEIYDLDADSLDDVEMLPPSDNFSPLILREIKPEIKLENRLNGMDIKAEVDDNSNSNASRIAYPSSIGDFLTRATPQLFLLQLPDALPGHGPVQEPSESAESEQNGTSSTHEQNFYTMAQMGEGLVGRLVRYRSGKTKLILGESKFDIDLGIDPTLMQEVISITTNRTERSGNMINVGQINAKLSAVPDWESMLHQTTEKKS